MPPPAAPRGIDHLVLCVGDLERAREFYRGLGFTLTPPARHPFGTANSLVQFAERSFLELLTVAEARAIPPMRPGVFSFGAFTRDFLARQEGCSMLVLDSADAEADQRAFRAAGLGDVASFHFERPARLPDGGTATVSFTLAFALDPRLPEAVFFTCRQHAPELFWKGEYQRHANGALGIEEAVLAAADPGALSGLIETVTGARAEPIEGGIGARTARGAICVLDPDAFSRRYGGVAATPLDRGPRFAGARIAIADLAQLAARLGDAGIGFLRTEGSLIVPPAKAFGFALAFVQRSRP